MSGKTQPKSPESAKYQRGQGPDVHGADAWLNAMSWYACIRRDELWLRSMRKRHGHLKLPSSRVIRMLDRNEVQVEFARGACRRRAKKLLRSDHRTWRGKSADVLAAVMLLARKSGRCAASYETIAAAAQCCERTVGRWMKRFHEAGILDKAGWVFAGTRFWNGREVPKFTRLIIGFALAVLSVLRNCPANRITAMLRPTHAYQREWNITDSPTATRGPPSQLSLMSRLP